MNTAIVKRGHDRLPAIFAMDAFDDMFESLFSPVRSVVDFDIEKLFNAPPGYPTDIVEVRDEKNGNVTGYEVDVTLAGIPKENVDISIEDDCLNVSVNKVEKTEKDSRTYLRKGISQRSMQLRYGLRGIDKDKIRANLVDGMLKVELPLAEEVKPKKIQIG